MGTYGLNGVLSAWKLGHLTAEQAVGQILQLLQELEARVGELEREKRAARTPSPAQVRRRSAE